MDGAWASVGSIGATAEVVGAVVVDVVLVVVVLVVVVVVVAVVGTATDFGNPSSLQPAATVSNAAP